MGTARVVFDRWDGRYAERIRDVRSSAVRDLFAAASRPDIISFSGGMPEVSRVPAMAVAQAALTTRPRSAPAWPARLLT